jgi:hypothetical protein
MWRNVMEAGAIAAIDKEELALYADPARASDLLLPALRRAARTPVHATPSGVTS